MIGNLKLAGSEKKSSLFDLTAKAYRSLSKISLNQQHKTQKNNKNEDGSIGIRSERLPEDEIPQKSLDTITYAYHGVTE